MMNSPTGGYRPHACRPYPVTGCGHRTSWLAVRTNGCQTVRNRSAVESIGLFLLRPVRRGGGASRRSRRQHSAQSAYRRSPEGIEGRLNGFSRTAEHERENHGEYRYETKRDRDDAKHEAPERVVHPFARSIPAMSIGEVDQVLYDLVSLRRGLAHRGQERGAMKRELRVTPPLRRPSGQ